MGRENKEVLDFTTVQSLIYELVIGDSLGVLVEFKARDSFLVTDMEGYGTYNQPPGTWSDDTSLTLALIEHLYEKSDLSDLMEKYVAYREGYLTPHGVCFDIGIATNQAIERYLLGNSPKDCGGNSEFDNGNGALMRLSPLAVILFNQSDGYNRAKMIECYSKITHSHPRSIVASILYIEVLLGLLESNSFKDALLHAKLTAEEVLSSNLDYQNEYELFFKDIFDADFFERERASIASTGYVVDTFKACIWCVGTTDSFADAVLKAVNLGEDTDTIGAITGTMAGVLYGSQSIP